MTYLHQIAFLLPTTHRRWTPAKGANYANYFFIWREILSPIQRMTGTAMELPSAL